MAKSELQARGRRILEPVVSALAAVGLPPMLVSLAGLGIALYGAHVLSHGNLAGAAFFLLLAGVCDILDGDLARRTGKASRFGAFVDSTLDRVTEFAYFGGILLYIVRRPSGFEDWEIIVTFVALAGSVLTSYARARAEGLGIECKVGLMERPERIVLLILGLLLGYRVLTFVLVTLAVTSTLTFLHRIYHVQRASGAGASAASAESADITEM